MTAAGASLVTTQKRWDGARAAAALRGMQLYRTDPADGVQRLVAVHGRQVFLVDRLDYLESLLIGAPTVQAI